MPPEVHGGRHELPGGDALGQPMSAQPGTVVLFSSGETSASGQRIYEWLFRRLSPPIRMAVLETPAGFQPNTALVAEKVAGFVRHHLQNYQPQVTVVPARQRGTTFSPDDPDIVAPLLRADVIFMGAGSPTYAVRQLQDSLAWHTLLTRHRLGAALMLASAAAIAASVQCLPVYEIYKVGADLHWFPGLDLFGPYGLSLCLVSHWNNTEGGAELDTSRGFVGRARFEQLRAMLLPEVTVVGLDEHTALAMDLAAQTCRVMGRGGVCLCNSGAERRFEHGQSFPLTALGAFRIPSLQEGIPSAVWQRVRTAEAEARDAAAPEPPAEVLALARQREAARARGDWAAADDLRKRIVALGWQIRDTGAGPELSLS
jgi:cyanophycinase-like exopeptidase